jgi:hypothetical protein
VTATIDHPAFGRHVARQQQLASFKIYSMTDDQLMGQPQVIKHGRRTCRLPDIQIRINAGQARMNSSAKSTEIRQSHEIPPVHCFMLPWRWCYHPGLQTRLAEFVVFDDRHPPAPVTIGSAA